jgi:hypothetical protein
MTLTPCTSIFIALAFALPLATAFLPGLGLDFKLKTEIHITGYDQPLFRLVYSFPSPTHALMFTVRDLPVGDVFISALLHIVMTEMQLEALQFFETESGDPWAHYS